MPSCLLLRVNAPDSGNPAHYARDVAADSHEIPKRKKTPAVTCQVPDHDSAAAAKCGGRTPGQRINQLYMFFVL
jgi:hypothetical protein